MNTEPKMNSKQTEWLKVLYQNAKKELSEKPIATTTALIAASAVLLPLVLSGSWRAFVLSQTSQLMHIQITTSLLPISASLLSLFGIAYLLHRRKKRKPEDFLFIPYESFTWKIKLLGNRQITIDPIPYCKAHQIKMICSGTDNDFFTCPICGTESGIKLHPKRRKILLEAVNNLAEAKCEDHILRDN